MARYYFAYGSNLSLTQMRTRCPDSQAVAAVSATRWRIAFYGGGNQRWGIGGVATLTQNESAVAHGALYLLTALDELAMDGFEGVAHGKYFKDETFGRHISCPKLTSADVIYAYIMSNPATPNLPSHKYLDTIRQGYQDWKLPDSQLLEQFRRDVNTP